MNYFSERYDPSKNEIKVDLNLSKFATKSDLKSATRVRTSKFAKVVELANLKPEIDKLDIENY